MAMGCMKYRTEYVRRVNAESKTKVINDHITTSDQPSLNIPICALKTGTKVLTSFEWSLQRIKFALLPLRNEDIYS
jgi:hypothetical protein